MLHQGNNPSQSIFISGQEVCIADLCHGVESYYLLPKWFTADFRKAQKDSHASRAPKDDDSSRMLGFHSSQSQHFEWHWLIHPYQVESPSLLNTHSVEYGCVPLPKVIMVPQYLDSGSISFLQVLQLLQRLPYCFSFSGTMNSKLYSHQNSKWMEFYLDLLFVLVSLFFLQNVYVSDFLQWCHQMFFAIRCFLSTTQ